MCVWACGHAYAHLATRKVIQVCRFPAGVSVAGFVVSSLVNIAVSELMNINYKSGCRSPSGGKFKTRTCASCARVPAEN